MDPARLRPWASRWLDLAGRSFLEGYLGETAGAGFLPEGADFDTLLNLFLLDKATYEIGYELNYRPSLLPIPLAGVSRLLSASTA
jgi:maltose alpha-D-glucosyltransferase/alpha-amylase